MLKPLFASLLLTAAATAAPGQTPTQTSPIGQWTVANAQQGCMVHAKSAQGTVLSISGMPGEEALLFVIQNQEFATLQNGQAYGIQVEFDEMGAWEIPAVAQQELDRDGPGLIFAIRPGRSDGANFLKEFAGASGMHIGRGEYRFDSLPLAGGGSAMSALATCLSEQWAGASGAAHTGQGGPLVEVGEEEEETEEAIPL